MRLQIMISLHELGVHQPELVLSTLAAYVGKKGTARAAYPFESILFCFFVLVSGAPRCFGATRRAIGARRMTRVFVSCRTLLLAVA